MLFDDENRLWLCMSKGLYSWEESAGLSFAGLKGQSVRCMVQMEDEVFFAGTDKGVFRLTKAGAAGSSSFETRPVDLHTEMHVESLYVSERSCSSVPFKRRICALTVPKGKYIP